MLKILAVIGLSFLLIFGAVVLACLLDLLCHSLPDFCMALTIACFVFMAYVIIDNWEYNK